MLIAVNSWNVNFLRYFVSLTGHLLVVSFELMSNETTKLWAVAGPLLNV